VKKPPGYAVTGLFFGGVGGGPCAARLGSKPGETGYGGGGGGGIVGLVVETERASVVELGHRKQQAQHRQKGG
jgi:hypothetical protein